MLLGCSSLAAPAAATSRALAPQGPAPDCPSIAEVNATPFAERWAVWDVPRCSSGCKFPSDQCGLGAPCCVHQRWAASRISSSRVTLSGNASNASASEDLRAELQPVLLLTARDPSVLPEKVLRSWIDLNPGLRFEVSSDADCLAYLRSAWGERHARFFESIRDGPIKADFWRAAKLYRDGGVYTDVDLQPVLPLSSADAAPGRFDQFAFREAVPESVGAMRSLIASAGLSSADCVEKSELRARSVVALERLAEAKRLRDARNE